MPTYEYVCDRGHETEARHSINDPALETCPREDCDAPAERKISLGGGMIVGGGSSSAPGGSEACGGSGFT